MKILMVCLGNICRSPLAEGILRKKALEAGLSLFIDSAGTSDYHQGQCPDERSTENALSHGIDISKLCARQFTVDDFDKFDKILVMDHSNYGNVMNIARDNEDKKKVSLILDYAYPGKNMAVPDPYFGGPDGFETVYNLLDQACDGIIQEIKNNTV